MVFMKITEFHDCRSERNANQPPPTTDGSQEIPYKLRVIMEAKKQQDLEKKSPAKRKKKPTIINKAGMAQHPEFKQGKYETLPHFYRRMDKAAQEAITKAELEVQFDVEFEKQGKNKLVISKKKDPVKEKNNTEAPTIT